MKFTKIYNIDKIGISSTKYLLNHFEDYLINNRFIILSKSDNILKYQYENFYVWNGLSLASFAKQGKIKLSVLNNSLEMKIYYTDYWAFSAVLAVAIIVFYFLNQETGNVDFSPISEIIFIYGIHFTIRYFAQLRLFKSLKKIMHELSD